MAAIGPIEYNSPVNFLIPQRIPENIPDEVKPVLTTIFNTMQQFILSLINNCGIGPQLRTDWPSLVGLPQTIVQSNMGRFYPKAIEAIPFGAAICLADDGTGVIGVKNANATDNTRVCHGFCSTVGGIAPGSVGEVILGSGLVSIGGLAAGTNYWLSTANGLITNGRPVAAGNIEQYLGVALTPTIMFFNMAGYIQH